MVKRKVCIVTGSRAEWGLLSPIATILKKRPDTELQIVATNMHLLDKFGHTVDSIRDEGFTISAEVPLQSESDAPADVAVATGRCMEGMAVTFSRLNPDVIVILGDRYELLAVTGAATIMRIPIVHLHGGEISEGAIDDSIRHAVTKLSSLHLTSATEHSRRVRQLGENPDMIHTIGAIGVANALAVDPLPKAELEAFLGVKLNRKSLMVTYHPVTAADESPEVLFANLLSALDEFPLSTVVFSYPNNDARGEAIIRLINLYVSRNPGRAVAFPSLGMKRYLSVLRYVGAVVGNSSSGIIEVPSMHIPTVDIGTRQKGRLAADSVIHCGDSAEQISRAIEIALSPEGLECARNVENPYFRPDTAAEAARLIAEAPLEELRMKRFFDL